jgi:hypothetical protein
MPRPKYILSDYLKNGLYWKLTRTVNFPIYSKADCRKISDLISKKNLTPISESTLYRLFLTNTKNNYPYVHTLDVLAFFCGYKNWYNLENHLNELQNFEWSFGKLTNPQLNTNSLLKICIHRNELKPLYEFAEQFDESLEIEKKYVLGAELFKGLKSSPNRNIQFFKNLSSLPIVRESFFELLADPAFTIKDYEAGIKYYLLGIKPEHSTRALQDFIFGNTLLFRYYYLNNKSTDCKKLGKKLYEEYNFSMRELNKINIFPRTRYLAYKLFHLSSANEPTNSEKHEEWLIDYAEKSIKNLSIPEQRILFYVIADSFCNYQFSIKEKQEQLKQVFKEVYNYLPTNIVSLNLKDQLPYLDQNATNIWKIF